VYRANLKEKSYLEGLAIFGTIIVQFISRKSSGSCDNTSGSGKRQSDLSWTSDSVKGEEFLG